MKRGAIPWAACGTALLACVAFAHARAETDDAVERALRSEDYTTADRLTRERVVSAEINSQAQPGALARALDGRAELLLDSMPWDSAETDDTIARELASAEAAGSTQALARARLHAARHDFQRADYAALRASVTAALTTAATLPSQSPDRAEIALLAAQADYYAFDRKREGMARAARALDVLRTHASDRPRAQMRALCAYGRMKRDVQENREAITLLRECERRAGELGGPRSAGRAAALGHLGYALREGGEYAAGTDALREGADIAAQRQPYDSALHARALMLLGTNLEMLGDLGRAREALTTAESLQDGKPCLNPLEHATLLGNLATHYYYGGDLERALTYDTRALPLLEQVLGPQASTVRQARINHAALLQESGRLDEAAAIYRAEIAAYEAAPTPGDGLLLAYANLAEIHLRQRHYAQAETLYERYLRRLGEGRDLTEATPAGAFAGIAAARWGQRRHVDAFAALRSAQESSMRARRAGLGELSERQMLSMANVSRDYAPLAIAIAIDSSDDDLLAQAWQMLLDADGAVTRHAALRLAEANAQGQAGRAAAIWREWRAANGALSRARVAAVRAPSKAAITALDHAQEQVDRIERRIAALDTRTGPALSAELGDLTRVRAALGDDTTLVRYVELDVAEPTAYRNDRTGDDAVLVALVGRRNDRLRAVRLGPVDGIAERVARWYALASRTDADATRTMTAARELHAAVFAPLAIDAGTRRLDVVPSATLQRVSLAALVDANGRYLAEVGPRFHLFNHEREALLPRAQSRSGLLLAGAATTRGSATEATSEPRATCPGLDAVRLAPLPGAAREISMLDELARGHVAKVDVLRGADATEGAVRLAMPGHSIVHLATHAFAFGSRCTAGGATRSIALDPLPADADTPDPSHLATLSVLAFLPSSAETEAGDGLLTSEEVATLDLAAADWVVLSACETALGATIGSEGVFGLRRAFRLAGARTVIMSLWKVDDDATAEFMRHLYAARLVDGLDTPSAMQVATRATLHARRLRGDSVHPVYWAGFVAAGSSR